MADAPDPPLPRGQFHRQTKGTVLEPITVRVERGRIRFLSQILGDDDPLFNDVQAARAAGHPDIAAPPSFFMVIEALADEERGRRSLSTAQELIGCDYRYLLHGDESYSYEGLIYAGDDVVLTTRVVDFFDKKGGLMEFARLRSEVAHGERGVLVRAERTLLHRFEAR